MLKMQQHFGKEYGVRKSSISEMQNGVRKPKRRCHLKRNLKSVPDWKGAGTDKIEGFWLKSFTAVYEALATVWTECLDVGDVPG